MKKIIFGAICCVLAVLLTSCSILAPEPETDVDTGARNAGKFEYGDISASDLFYYEPLKKLFDENVKQFHEYPTVSADKHVGYIPEEYKAIHSSSKACVMLNDCVGYPFAELCSQMGANPFTCFNLLVENEMVEEKVHEDSGVNESGTEFEFEYIDCRQRLNLHSMQFSSVPKEYPYTKQGCEEFLRMVVLIDKTNDGNLNNLYAGEYPEAHYSQEDNCYYSFVIKYDTSYAYVTALYIRSDDEKVITDVTLQTMTITFPISDCSAGIGISMHCNANEADFEAVCLVTAVEQALTGTCYFNENTDFSYEHGELIYTIPFEYSVADYSASLERKIYLIKDKYYERFTTYTYLISK